MRDSARHISFVKALSRKNKAFQKASKCYLTKFHALRCNVRILINICVVLASIWNVSHS